MTCASIGEAIVAICLALFVFPAARGFAEVISADSVVLVNSNSSDYDEFEERIQPYLDHFDIPYVVHDIFVSPVVAATVDRALIIVGHRRLDETGVLLDGAEQGAISAAVAGGAGLVSFDSLLADGSHVPLYSFVQDVFPASYHADASAGSVEIQAAPLHYISRLHAPAESLSLKSNMNVKGMTAPPDATVVASAGGEPLVTARMHAQGKVVLWGSTEWSSMAVKGPVYGLDDLVWRSLVWAARKPFVMQGMPPFLTVRVDDVEGPLWWVDVANEFGLIPWLGVFSRDIDLVEGAQLSAQVAAGNATVSIHSLTGSDFFYMDHWITWTDWPDAVMAAHFAEGTQWHLTNGIPVSKVVVPHLYEIGTNAFDGLASWGVEFIVTQMEPGNLYQNPWLQLGPYRRFESGNSGAAEPHFYADYLEIPNHPELQGEFFNCVTEIRDDAGYEWFPNADVQLSIDRGTRQSKRSFDSMVLATLFTHEYHIDFIPEQSWRDIFTGITANLAPYEPVYVSLDHACQYVRATRTSKITASVLDPATGWLTTTLSGSADMATQFYLFTDSPGGIVEERIDVPAFSLSAQVVTLTARSSAALPSASPRLLLLLVGVCGATGATSILRRRGRIHRE